MPSMRSQLCALPRPQPGRLPTLNSRSPSSSTDDWRMRLQSEGPTSIDWSGRRAACKSWNATTKSLTSTRCGSHSRPRSRQQQCNTLGCNTVRCNTVQCNTVQCNTALVPPHQLWLIIAASTAGSSNATRSMRNATLPSPVVAHNRGLHRRQQQRQRGCGVQLDCDAAGGQRCIAHTLRFIGEAVQDAGQDLWNREDVKVDFRGSVEGRKERPPLRRPGRPGCRPAPARGEIEQHTQQGATWHWQAAVQQGSLISCARQLMHQAAITTNSS